MERKRVLKLVEKRVKNALKIKNTINTFNIVEIENENFKVECNKFK